MNIKEKLMDLTENVTTLVHDATELSSITRLKYRSFLMPKSQNAKKY